MNKYVIELLEDLNATSWKKGISWKGYNVYIPQYKGNPCIALPYVILEKGREVRISTPEESEEYLDFEIENSEKE